ADMGASRMLLEGKYLFDIVDLESDWRPYQVLILPDRAQANEGIAAKLEAYIPQGGRVLATGLSGLHTDGTGFVLDFGAQWVGANAYQPDYFVAADDFGPAGRPANVMYSSGQQVQITDGTVLGYRENPYFNRDAFS